MGDGRSRPMQTTSRALRAAVCAVTTAYLVMRMVPRSWFYRLMYGLLGLVGAIAIHGGAVAIAPSWLPSAQATPTLQMARQMAAVSPVDARIVEIEQTWEAQYSEYFGTSDRAELLTADAIRSTLSRLNAETRTHFALLYIFPQPDYLETLLVIPDKRTVRLTFPGLPKSVLDPVLEDFRSRLARPLFLEDSLESAQQLYQWLIAPLESYLTQDEIDTLVFCVGAGLRSTPLAALHDGQHFLVERYGVSVIPAFSLTDPNYDRLRQTRILAMGASQFQDLNALPAVPFELATIAEDLWNGEVYLNEQFTQSNLQRQLNSGEFAIVHLATHAAFRPGAPDNSYIQLWQNERINLNELQDLGWRDRPIDLLVLSACQTAMGDPQAELGFAGLSFQSGVKSTLASLWNVSDIGTLALMHEFYTQLANPTVTTKAEALRRAQVAMIQDDVRIEDGQLISSHGRLPLPDSLEKFRHVDMSGPYYWAGFTLVGSPW